MSEPTERWLRWPYLWISWRPWIKDPLGPCTNVLKMVCDHEIEDSLQVVDIISYDQLKAERDSWKEMAERLVLAVRLEKGLFPSKFTNDILDEFDNLKSKL